MARHDFAVLSPWYVNENDDNEPRVTRVLRDTDPGGNWSVSDATGQQNVPPTPNLCVFAGYCQDAAWAAVEAHPDLLPLWNT